MKSSENDTERDSVQKIITVYTWIAWNLLEANILLQSVIFLEKCSECFI